MTTPAQLDSSPPTERLSLQSSSSEPETVESHNEEQPTASHGLADESINAAPEVGEEKGTSQMMHNNIEIKDIGWNKKAENVPGPMVSGLTNEETWTLIRRFDKQVFHVKGVDTPPLANLDMNIADDEEFSPDKLRAHLERLYISVAISLFAFWKHIVRLRSWRESRRTGCFLAVYALAWLLDLTILTLVGFLMLIVLHRPARDICFPPVPPSLVDSDTGGVQTPAAGHLASEDSVTGAAENHDGEAVEQEARSFVNSIAALAIGTSAGKPPQDESEDNSPVPDPTEITEQVPEGSDKKNEEDPEIHDKTKQPVSEVVWDKARSAMIMIADFVDTWERFANALNPTPPFPTHRPRLTLAACLLPVFVLSYFTTSYMLLKGISFGTGFGFFGDPIINRATAKLNKSYPNWQKHLELRHTILRGIPTNAQLAITLLRIGERNKAPLPPPPASDEPPSVETNHGAVADAEQNLGASNIDIRAAAQAPPTQNEPAPAPAEKPKKSRRILNMIRATAKSGIHTALTADKAKAKAGAKHALDRLGVVKHDDSTAAGPIQFPARYKGEKGHAYITITATTPAVSWTANLEDVDPAWTVLIADVNEIKKIGGLGWKSKIVVEWALDTETVGGLMLTTKEGKEFYLTAITIRNELFNRLVAIGNQMWESL